MAQINPYLTFNGNCYEAFEFYKAALGGQFNQVSKFKDMPPAPGHPPIAEKDKERIMHMSLPISKETILMGSDSNPMMGEVKPGHNISLSVTAESKEEADRIFKKLAEGGKITMPIADMFWGAYFGMLDDKFGNSWMINFDYPK